MFLLVRFGFQPILFVFVVIKKFLRSIEILAIRNDINDFINPRFQPLALKNIVLP
jgi:hypothetical protein